MKKNQATNKDESKRDSSAITQSDKNETKFPGYPFYPGEEDLYVQNEWKSDLDPEDPIHLKAPNALPDSPNHLNKDDAGQDLDIPGAELDDAQEAIGSEDEENNYYSLGGDDKEGLEENQGESA